MAGCAKRCLEAELGPFNTSPIQWGALMVPIEECKISRLRSIDIDGLEELPHRDDRIEAKSSRDVNELDRAQTPFSALVFGDKGLRFAEARGDVRLRQATLLSKVTQQLAKLDLSRRAQRVAHCRKPGSRRTVSLRNPDFGLSHFGIYS
jgi:hypothetical protein